MENVERLFRILLGKHAGEVIQPGVNSWNIECRPTEKGFAIVFHCMKPKVLQVDLKDLEIISNLFFTRDINLGNENKVKTGCNTCNLGSDHEFVIWVNNPGVKPEGNKFLFPKIAGERVEGWYYYLKSPKILTECIAEYKANETLLSMV